MIAVLLIFLINNAEIKSALDRKYASQKLTIGDPFNVTIEIVTDHGTKINGPFIDGVDSFVITDVKRKTVGEKGRNVDIFNLRLVPFQTGELEIPPLLFLNINDGQIDTLTSPSIPITIHSVLPAGMKDINRLKPAVEYPNYVPLIIFVAALAIGGLGYAGYRIYQKYCLTRTRPRPLPLPWIEAQIALENIPLASWLEKGLVKTYYYTLSEILKRYLERRFAFSALEQTTTEIMNCLKSLKTPMQEEFGHFFERADLVKYAKLRPPDEELSAALATARGLVQKTIPPDCAASEKKH